MRKKLGFALGAGGSRGTAHIGFLKAMEEHNIIPDFISGTSMGSVVGACYAKGYSPSQMEEIVKKLKFSDIFDLSINPVKNSALLRSQKMQKQLKKYIGEVKFSDLKIPFTCVATDMTNGISKVFNDPDEKVCLGVTASSSVPGVFKPINKNGIIYVDGGILCRVPVQAVRDMGAEVIVAVDVLGKIRKFEKKFNVFSILTRVFDITDCQITAFKKDIQCPDLFIEPDLGDMIQYKFKDIDMAIEKGYEIGCHYADEIKELIK